MKELPHVEMFELDPGGLGKISGHQPASHSVIVSQDRQETRHSRHEPLPWSGKMNLIGEELAIASVKTLPRGGVHGHSYPFERCGQNKLVGATRHRDVIKPSRNGEELLECPGQRAIPRTPRKKQGPVDVKEDNLGKHQKS